MFVITRPVFPDREAKRRSQETSSFQIMHFKHTEAYKAVQIRVNMHWHC